MTTTTLDRPITAARPGTRAVLLAGAWAGPFSAASAVVQMLHPRRLRPAPARAQPDVHRQPRYREAAALTANTVEQRYLLDRARRSGGDPLSGAAADRPPPRG
jgi:hypothetical protein